MLNKILPIILIVFISSFSKTWAQENTDFYSYEDSLRSGFDILFSSDGTRYTLNDSSKDVVNHQLIKYFEKTLKMNGSFKYPFDSIKQVGKIYSEDNNLRLITWNIKYKDGSYKYFGFIQHYNSKKKKYETWRLFDDSENMIEPLKLSLYHHHWYGCLYYQIVEQKYNGKKIYTLIGWDGNNYLSNKKVLDVLYFTSSGKPRFGKNIFKMGKKRTKRLIFEYSAQIVMFVRYEKRYKKIVYDHLIPSPKSMVGKYEFYYPDGTYDALEYVGNKWIHRSDFYATNRKDKQFDKDLQKKPDVQRSDDNYRPK